MRLRVFRMIAPVVAVFALGLQAKGDIITQWTFETSVPATAGPISPEVGSGTAVASLASGSAVFSNPVGNGSGESWSTNNWSVGDYFQFQVSTTGYESITLLFDHFRSSTGPATFALQYSTNGSSFTTATTYNPGTTSWSSLPANFRPDGRFEFDLSAITTINDAATVYFRLTDTTAPSAGGGTSRVDNFTVNGTAVAVPEPSSIALVGLGVVGLGLLRRRMRVSQG